MSNPVFRIHVFTKMKWILYTALNTYHNPWLLIVNIFLPWVSLLVHVRRVQPFIHVGRVLLARIYILAIAPPGGGGGCTKLGIR